MREVFARPLGRSRPRFCAGADSSESLSFNALAQAEYENDDEAQFVFAQLLSFQCCESRHRGGKTQKDGGLGPARVPTAPLTTLHLKGRCL
jgi:hypothetical protein